MKSKKKFWGKKYPQKVDKKKGRCDYYLPSTTTSILDRASTPDLNTITPEESHVNSIE